jgi:HlyD family secretion protein
MSMDSESPAPPIIARLRRKPVRLAALAVVALGAIFLVLSGSRPAKEESSFFEVKRGDFLISIVEGGTVDAVDEQIIRSEVEGTARIIYIVPEGSTVRKGDLLVELDSAQTQDAVNQQQINVEKAQFALIQAEQQLEIQKSTVDSEVAAAQLKVEFAASDLEKYVKGEALQQRRNAQIEITNVIETLAINEDRLQWTEELYKQGYETKSTLDNHRLAVSQAKLKLEQARQALWLLETFDEPKKKRELEALLQEARDNLARVKLMGERKLDQYRADVQTQKSTLELSQAKLERDKKTLLATKIYAPTDGLVVYAGGGGDRRWSSESMIEEGAVVRNRQEIIKLPDISCMKLSIKIHESHIGNVRLGQPAFIVLDAMPDKRLRGQVSKVAPLPDSSSRWGNPNLKVYATEVLITDPLPNIKPGVSARAEIIITNLENVLTVPIQAVTTRRGQQVVFLAEAPQQPVPVSVGMYNIKFIEITSGLKEGDRVLLSPPFDTEAKDLAGAILAAGEKPPEANDPGRLPESGQRLRNRNGRNWPPDDRRPGEPGLGQGSDPAAGRGPGMLEGSEPRPGRGNRRGGLPGEDSDGSSGAGRPVAAEGGGPRLDDGASPGPSGGSREGNREEMLKRFDTNGDGQLDESERTAMREALGRLRPGGLPNAAPDRQRPRPDGVR